MGRHLIYERKMNSSERSARSMRQQRQELVIIRDTLHEVVTMLLEHSYEFANFGEKEKALKAAQMAEIQTNNANLLTKRLKAYEGTLNSEKQPVPAFENDYVYNPRASMVLTKELTEIERLAERKQAEYAAFRAARRPEIELRYGRLAKAEKAEAAE